MAISKKKLAEINSISLLHEVIGNHYAESKPFGDNEQPITFIDHAPENWSREEKVIFDSLAELEQKLKERVLIILNTK